MKESEIKDLIIRPMTDEDVISASNLEAKVFSMPWKAEDFRQMVNAPYAYYYVAICESNVVGICGLRDIAGEGEITNVAVDENYRRLGIARKLVGTVIAKCDELKINDITLEVRVSNINAIALYESYGFKSEGIRPKFYEKPVEDAMIMWRRNNNL